MTEWIISGNPFRFDIEGAFHELKKVDWTQSANISAEDIVYIYVSGNVKAIQFKCRANKVNICVPDIDDRKFNLSDDLGNSDGRYMELELLEELNGDAYTREELMKHGFQSPMGPIKMPDSIKEYLMSISAEPTTNITDINYIGVLDYLEHNREIPYTKPDKITDLTERSRLLDVMRKGQDAVNELKKMAALCRQKFGLDKCLPVAWLDGSNTKTKKYLWVQMKYSDRADDPTSISIFVEMINRTVATYRISLEIKNDGADQATMERYHSHLDLPLNQAAGLTYFSGANEWGRPGKMTESREWIRDEVNAGNIRKVQISKYVEQKPDQTNGYFEQGILAAVQAILPYYNHVVGKGEMDELEVIDPVMKKPDVTEFDKNMILYGPPGTGKTYSSAIYAVAICDGKKVEDIKEWDYNDVMNRYHELQKEGRVAFTTFHQSYGYEEFIEGIKPVMSKVEGDGTGNDIKYDVFDGVFKSFCDSARTATVQSASKDLNISSDASVWKVTIQNRVKQDCFNNNQVRIDWGFDSDGAAGFVEEMHKGDIILTTDGSRTQITGIALVTEEAAVDLKTENDATCRAVKWLAKDLQEDITTLNKGKVLHRRTVARVPSISTAEIIALAKRLNPINQDLADTVIIENTKPYVFVIDEINRGNISKIFGELITLIEETKREGSNECIPAILPYSGDEFTVPQNVYLLGTMNTADRSIALMDTALRRRFQFVEMMPNADVLRAIGADKVQDLDVAAMLEKINERITFLYDREHTIGHAFFTKLKHSPDIKTLSMIFRKSIIPLLQEYFYEDYQKIQLVLGDNGKSDPMYKFIKDEEVKVKSIFKGNADDVVDLPEKKYSINEDAFEMLDAYKEII